MDVPWTSLCPLGYMLHSLEKAIRNYNKSSYKTIHKMIYTILIHINKNLSSILSIKTDFI